MTLAPPSLGVMVPRHRWTVLGATLAVASSLLVASNANRPAQAATADPVLYAAGDVAQCDAPGDEATAALIQPALAANTHASVAMLGDGAGYFNSFTDAASPVTAPGAPPGVYSYDLDAWHVIVLNSTCGSAGGSGVGGCNASSPMADWVRADLARTQAKCMIAVWHHPRFYSASKLANLTPTPSDTASHDSKLNDIWDILQKAGVDIALSGHHHVYERMAKMDARPDGTPGTGVPDPTNGMRQFMVGTGGGPYE